MNPILSYIGALHLIEETARIVREAIKNGQQVNSDIEITGTKVPGDWIPDGGCKITVVVCPRAGQPVEVKGSTPGVNSESTAALPATV